MPQLEIAASSHNLPPLTTVLGSAATVRTFLDDSGYDGLQYMPAAHVRSDFATELVRDGTITSLHQSWVWPEQPSGLKDRLLHEVFPTLQQSMPIIKRLAAAAMRPASLPAVVHPDGQHLGHKPPYHGIHYNRLEGRADFGPFLHQPTLEVLDAWHVLNRSDGRMTAEDMIAEQSQRGFNGVALDLHHLTTERGGISPLDLPKGWHEAFVATLAELDELNYPSEVQVSIRPDFDGRAEDLRSAVAGDWLKTPHGVLLQAIAGSLPAEQDMLRVTTEVPANVWKKVGLGWRGGNKQLVAALKQSPIAV